MDQRTKECSYVHYSPPLFLANNTGQGRGCPWAGGGSGCR